MAAPHPPAADASPAPKRLLVVDDEALVRDAYAAFFAARSDYEVCGEARSGEEAVAAYDRLRPEIVLMDLQLAGLDGVSATREICRRHPGACIVALTTFGTRDHIVAALRAGAAGYLLKDAGADAVLTALAQAVAGDMPLSGAVRRELVSAVVAPGATPPPGPAPVAATGDDLTPREREVVLWLAQGLTNQQIAAQMFVSEGSVKQHLSHVADKWCVKSRTQILVRAIQAGVIDPHRLPTP